MYTNRLIYPNPHWLQYFWNFRYFTLPKSCQRFVVCSTVFMRCHINQLKCVVASAIPTFPRLFGVFSRHSLLFFHHTYVFICFIILYCIFPRVFYHNPHSHASNGKSNLSFLAWSMFPHSNHQQHYQKKKLQHIWCLFCGGGGAANKLFSFFMNGFLFCYSLQSFWLTESAYNAQ